jgi:hypothetical protein
MEEEGAEEGRGCLPLIRSESVSPDHLLPAGSYQEQAEEVAAAARCHRAGLHVKSALSTSCFARLTLARGRGKSSLFASHKRLRKSRSPHAERKQRVREDDNGNLNQTVAVSEIISS